MSAPLKGAQCECSTCKLVFVSLRSFDEHKTGDYATASTPSTRRCLSAKEMMEAGWTMTYKGIWRMPKSKAKEPEEVAPEAVEALVQAMSGAALRRPLTRRFAKAYSPATRAIIAMRRSCED